MSVFFEGIEIIIREMIREEIRSVLDERLTHIPDGPKPQFSNCPKLQSADSEVHERLLKAAEVAEILDVSVQGDYELARQRKANGLPVILLSDRQYRFSRKQINSWIERGGAENHREEFV